MGSINDILASGNMGPSSLDIQAQQAGIAHSRAATEGQQAVTQSTQLANQLSAQQLRDSSKIRDAYSRVDPNLDPDKQRAAMLQDVIKNGASAPAVMDFQKHLLGLATSAATLKQNQDVNAHQNETYNNARAGDILQAVKAAGAEGSTERINAAAAAAPQLKQFLPEADLSKIDNRTLDYQIGASGHLAKVLEQANAQADVASKAAKLPGEQADTQQKVADQAFRDGPGKGLTYKEAQAVFQAQSVQMESHRHNLATEVNAEAQRRLQEIGLSQTGTYQQGELGIKQKELDLKTGGTVGNLNPAQKKIADSIANGDTPLSALGRFPPYEKERILADAQTTNSEYAQAYPTKQAFSNPDHKQSQNIGTISRIVGHIGRYEENSKTLGVSAEQAIGHSFSGTAKSLDSDAQAISGELEKLVSGGVGSVGQVQEWQKNLRSTFPGVRQKAVDEISKLVGSQYEGMAQTYKSGTKEEFPVEKFLNPAGQKFLRDKGINVKGSAAEAAPVASGGGTQVKDPRGVVHTFPNAEAAARFRKAAGL